MSVLTASVISEPSLKPLPDRTTAIFLLMQLNNHYGMKSVKIAQLRVLVRLGQVPIKSREHRKLVEFMTGASGAISRMCTVRRVTLLITSCLRNLTIVAVIGHAFGSVQPRRFLTGSGSSVEY